MITNISPDNTTHNLYY